MFAPVLLAASEERLVRYRHPVPHGGPLGKQAMLVVCAERGGLFVSLTRMIYFQEPDPQTARRQEACGEVLRRMREEATREGRTLAQAFEDCRRFYAEAGFPEGWRDHHQGGMTGYASREIIATPGTQQEIREGQAFAWNPSLEGAKAEETFVLGPDGPRDIDPPVDAAFPNGLGAESGSLRPFSAGLRRVSQDGVSRSKGLPQWLTNYRARRSPFSWRR